MEFDIKKYLLTYLNLKDFGINSHWVIIIKWINTSYHFICQKYSIRPI